MDDSTSHQKQVSNFIWKKNRKAIAFKLNVAIFPYLMQESLISDRAGKKYTDPKCFDYQKIDLLVTAVPMCGHNDYLLKFIWCLRSSAADAGDAHNELADLLESEYKDMLTRQVSLTEEISKKTIYDPQIGAMFHKESVSSVITITSIREGASSMVGNGYSQKDYDYHKLRNTFGQTNLNKRKMKERGKWIIIHASVLIWLLLGSITIIIVLNSVPKQTSSSPLSVRCGQPNVMLAIDLGIDLFWLSSATFTMDSTRGSSTLYVANISREDVPTSTTIMHRLLYPPFYLAQGSNYSVTNNLSIPVEFWFIKSEPRNCPDQYVWNCSDPQDDNKICEKTKSGEATSLYTVNVSDYYTFCVNPATKRFTNTETLNLVTYDLTAIQERSRQRMEMSRTEKTVNLNMYKWFDFHKEELSIFLHINSCGGDDEFNELPLKIEVHRRMDILCIPILIALILAIFHLLITVIVHIRQKRLCRRQKNNTINYIR